MPPLAATVAATLAVRAGVSLLRAARERRAVGERERDRRFGLLRGEPLAEAVRRIALGQLDVAIASLDGRGDPHLSETAVHEARKALKRLRALLSLIESELGSERHAREDAVLDTIAQRLSATRDADVLLATLDALVERHPRRLRGRGGVLRLRAQLLSEVQSARGELQQPAAVAQAIGELSACRVRVAAWSLPERDGLSLLEPGLARIYRQGRKRQRRVAAGRGARTRAMHRWRKRVKDLRYAAQMLQLEPDTRPSSIPKRGRDRRRRREARRDAAWLRRLERQADALGELLGEEHDLAVMRDYVRAQPRGKRGGARVGRGTRRSLERLIAARRRQLRKEALRRGERLYRRTPERFLRRVRRAHRGALRSFS